MLPLMLGVEGSEIAGNAFVQALFPIPMLGVSVFSSFLFFLFLCFMRCFSSYRAFSFPMSIIHALRVPPSAALPRRERIPPIVGAPRSQHGNGRKLSWHSEENIDYFLLPCLFIDQSCLFGL